MPIPEHELNACLEVMRDAILQARVWGGNGEVPAKQLADLMDAIHDVPTHIQLWDEIPAGAVRDRLQAYDKKYPGSVDGKNGLLHLYDHVVKSARDQVG